MTPMMTQYHHIKKQHPDCLLFYRMGDFYELFFEDAITAAKILGITLTKRGQMEGDSIAMCGVPFHAAEGYLAKLVRYGLKVAICEQMENPTDAKKRGAKSLVAREVIRIVTPGTLTEDSLLEGSRHNFLITLVPAHQSKTKLDYAVAAVDISTGDFFSETVDKNGLSALLMRLNPSEIVLPEQVLKFPDLFELFADWKRHLTPLPVSRFDSHNATARLLEFFKVATLDGFGHFPAPELTAAGTLLDYIQLTQKGHCPNLKQLMRLEANTFMEIDASTQRNLEIMTSLSGKSDTSLFASINRTLTNAGGRLLSLRLTAPLRDVGHIETRLQQVDFFVGHENSRSFTRQQLKGCPDLERALARLTAARGGPRDLAVVRNNLTTAFALNDHLMTQTAVPDKIGFLHISMFDSLYDRLSRALSDNLPMLTRDGHFIAPGYHAELDEVRKLRDHGRQVMSELQARYQSELGITSLKIKHNNILGYHVEVTASHQHKLDDRFIHRQTMVSGMRFTTADLSELETKLVAASDRALSLELRLFEDLVSEISGRADEIAKLAHALARLDVVSSLAELAIQQNYSRPKVDHSLAFDIDNGRHPVVEQMLQHNDQTKFVANNCQLNDHQQIWLITGPNMAGKSTFLRQNAVIVIMAQMGGYVPATAAHIGIVDKLFSRVGAADDLARGRSTFMVEMVETAAILNQATAHSLVILDEVGRGTATYDGLSIAWSTVEYLHQHNRSRALFATHYHELTQLQHKLQRLACYTMNVREWNGSPIFLHEIIAGVADRSYGIHVAQLAGLPKKVIERATALLEVFEKTAQSNRADRSELSLFQTQMGEGDDYSSAYSAQSASPLSRRPAITMSPAISSIVDQLSAVDLDELSPRQAVEIVHALKSLLAT